MSHFSHSDRFPPFLRDLLGRLQDPPLFSVFLTTLLFFLVATIYAFSFSSDDPREENTPLMIDPVERSDFERYQHSYQNISREIFDIAKLRTNYNFINYERTGEEGLGLALSPHGKDLNSAVVLGIDETVLDNTIFWLWQKGKRGKTESELWGDFIHEELSGLNRGAKEYINWLKDLNIEIFFISSRTEDQREATLSNLAKLGIQVKKERIFFLGDGRRLDLEKKDIFYKDIKSSYNLLLAMEDDFSVFLNSSPHFAQLKSGNPILFSAFFQTF